MDRPATTNTRRVEILRVAAAVPCDPKTARKRLDLGEEIRGGLSVRIDEVARDLGIRSAADSTAA